MLSCFEQCIHSRKLNWFHIACFILFTETHEENEIQGGEEGADDEGDVDAAVTSKEKHQSFPGHVTLT